MHVSQKCVPPGSSKCSTTLKYTQQNYFPESSYKIYMLQVCWNDYIRNNDNNEDNNDNGFYN